MSQSIRDRHSLCTSHAFNADLDCKQYCDVGLSGSREKVNDVGMYVSILCASYV